MKKERTKNRLSQLMVWGIVVLGTFLFLPKMNAQITIAAEPAGPLYVGDTITVSYTAAGFTADAVYYLVLGGDTILASSSAVAADLTGVVPAGYDPSATLEVYAISGDLNGQEEINPIWGELITAGTNSTYNYEEVSYSPYFWEAGIRRMQLPSLNLVGDSAVFEFSYWYDSNPDSLELVVEYSINSGTSFTPLDTVFYTGAYTWYTFTQGIPAAARTSNTILRVRQLYSNIQNSNYSYDFYLADPVVYVGQVPVTEGSTALAGSPFVIDLPYTMVTSVTSPVTEPYFGNLFLGDSILITATVTGFTDDTKFEVVFNRSGDIDDPVYHLRNINIVENTPGLLEIDAKLPTNMPFNDNYYFWVVPYKGTSYEHGSYISHYFPGGAGNHDISGGTIDATYGIYFTSENLRQVETSDLMISDEGTIMLELSRRDDLFSPSNTEILVEYSIDEGVSYTEITSLSLNDMLVYDQGSTTFEVAIPAAAVSSATRFRIRQKDINAENLDRFYVLGYDIILNTTRLIEGEYAEYAANYGFNYVNNPDIDLKTITVPEDLFYPGTSTNLAYSITVGEFPANLDIQAVFTTPNPDILVGENTLSATVGTINVTVPSVQGGTNSVRLQTTTPMGPVYSNTRTITVEEVDLNIIGVVGDPLREVDAVPYYFAGDQITVDYNLIGSAPGGVNLQIQNTGGDWITLSTDDPADGQVVGIIPTDEDLSSSPNIRLALNETVFTNSWSVDYLVYGDPGFPENEEDSLIVSAVGMVDILDALSDYWATFGTAGVREFISEPFEFDTRGRISLYFWLIDNYAGGWDQQVDVVSPIYLQYSTDGGTTWVEMDSFNPLDYSYQNTTQGISVSYTIPFELLGEQLTFRMVQNEDEVLEYGENPWALYYFQVEGSTFLTLQSGTETLNLQQASLALGNLDKSVYGPGEAITVPYNVVGNFGTDVGFAVYLENNNNDLFLVETSDATGLVQLETSLPVNIPETFENSDDYDLQVYPFQKSVGVDVPIVGYMEDYDDDAEDAALIEGGEWQSANSWYYFYDNARRSLLTKALPQLDGDSAYFSFNLYLYEALFPSEGIVVEMTTDGGATFTPLDTLTESGTKTIAMATADMTSTTHLRWVQRVNFGLNQKRWRLSNMMYKSAESNIITDGYLSVNQPKVIEVDYPDFPSEFNVSTQQDVIYSGESFDFDLTITDGIDIRMLPATTEYYFYLGDASGNIFVDAYGDSVMLGMMTGTGATTLNVPESIFKNNYKILTTAQIAVPGEDDPYTYFDMVNTTNLAIYNPLLKTMAVTEEAYRGDDISVDWELQTGSLTTANYWFHVVVNDEIIYTQKDVPAGNFLATLPTDIATGNNTVKIMVTTDSAYYKGDDMRLDVLNNDEWVDQGNMYLYVNYNDYVNNYIRFNQVAEANRIVSAQYDLSQGAKVTFKMQYDDNGPSLLQSNKIYFEYSTDGGDTYTVVDEFPNEDYKVGDGSILQTYYFAKDVNMANTQFRFRRQNGNYGYAYVRQFDLMQLSNEAPLELVADQVSVLSQSIVLGGLPTSICPGGTVNLDYTINGRFGDLVTHTIQYYRDGNYQGNFPNLEFTEITEGSGTFDITMPESFPGGNYEFQVYSNDVTTENTISVTSLTTEDEMYLVPAITFDNTTLEGDQSLCESGVISYNLYNTQPYFVYQARDVATGLDYGDPVSNKTGGTQVMFSENVDSDLKLEFYVQSMSPDGMLTCASGVLSDRIQFKMVPDRDLFAIDNSAGVWTPAEDTSTICEGNPLGLNLQAAYYDKDGNYISGGITSIMWYRDDLTNAISSNNTLDEFAQSGDYFAEVLVNGCKYTTSTTNITVLSVPDKPTISASGATEFCEGSSVTLSADATAPYYRWYGGYSGNTQMSGSSQSIEALVDGAYRLQVSDYPLELGCLSPLSDPLLVTVVEQPSTSLQHAVGGTYVAEDNYVSCGDDVILSVNNSPETFSWTINGSVFTSTLNQTQIVATQTGYYNVQSIATQKDVTCTFKTKDSIYVQITPELPRPSLTLTAGSDEFCSGEGSATLTAPTGYDSYIWSLGEGGSVFAAGSVSENEIVVTDQSGNYEVSVVDEYGCVSQVSLPVEIDIIPLPGVSSNVWAMDYLLCGPNVAEIRVEPDYYYYGDRTLNYQLVDIATGQFIGTPKTKTLSESYDYVVLKTDTIREEREFGVLVSDVNASGCEVMLDETVIIDANIADITAIGNQLYATPGGDEYQWYRNGEPILAPRGTSNSIEVYDDAEYTVTIVFDFDCILSISQGEVKNLTGLVNELTDENVTIYPNPVQNKVNIEFVNSYVGDITVEVSNLAGQVLLNSEVQKHSEFMNFDLDLGVLDEGVYFINFITNQQSLVKSIVKQ